MIEVRQTRQFHKWLKGLKDRKAQAVITERLFRLSVGQFGDVKRIDGVSELRIFIGPGYRAYFVERDATLIILLCGGDKGSQKRDIKRAISMAKEI